LEINRHSIQGTDHPKHKDGPIEGAIFNQRNSSRHDSQGDGDGDGRHRTADIVRNIKPYTFESSKALEIGSGRLLKLKVFRLSFTAVYFLSKKLTETNFDIPLMLELLCLERFFN
jgi:hypothetical protein